VRNVEHIGSEHVEGLWDWNLVTDRIHYSPRWLSLIGCDAHEPSHTPDVWLGRVHPDDQKQLLRDLERLSAEGDTFEFRHRMRHQDGFYRWMVCCGSVVRNERREAISFAAVIATLPLTSSPIPLPDFPIGSSC
jgi:PAS domain-containing protein